MRKQIGHMLVNIFSLRVSDKGLVSRICKKFFQIYNNKKQSVKKMGEVI